MTDNEIRRALEICLPLGSDCSLCPLLEETHCYDHLLSEVLDLFNRQKAEIELLKKENDHFADIGNKLRKANTNAYYNGVQLCVGLFFKKLENALADNIDISHAQYESIMFDVHNIVDELKIKELTE